MENMSVLSLFGNLQDTGLAWFSIDDVAPRWFPLPMYQVGTMRLGNGVDELVHFSRLSPGLKFASPLISKFRE